MRMAIRQHILVFIAAITTVLLSIPAASADGSASPRQEMQQPARAIHHNVGSTNSLQDARQYWTPERMASAIPSESLAPKANSSQQPLEQKGSGVIARPAAPTLPTAQNPALNVGAPSTLVKIFFQIDGANYVGSGAVVNNPGKNAVATAGHIVKKPGGSWATNMYIIPAYYGSYHPYGDWVADIFATFHGWGDQGNAIYDQAFVKVRPNDGVNIVNKVGGDGLVYTSSTTHDQVQVWGYPTQTPYDGQTAVTCYGKSQPNTTMPAEREAKITCGMTPGGDGGPWGVDQGTDPNVFYVSAVTSRWNGPGTYELVATPYSQDVANLFNGLGW